MILRIDQKEWACIDVVYLLQMDFCLVVVVASALSIRKESTFGIQLVVDVDLILDHSVDLTLVFQRVIFDNLLNQRFLVSHGLCRDGHVIIKELQRMINERRDGAVSLPPLNALADRFPPVSMHHVPSIP